MAAEDRFEIYYAEKLWEMIPAIYRHEDGMAENPGVLRALVEVMAQQAAILRRSQDRLWEDQFIEWSDDWAVPYIGDLLGTRLISALNKRGLRIDVAKTIYYRRRKGTLRVLEELISDISNWEGKVVEGFQSLARTSHSLDPRPSAFAGPFTGTLPRGTANLHSPSGSELAESPFDEFYHTPDFRKPRGLDGRYGITRLNFHLYRLRSYEVTDVTPFSLSGTTAGLQFMFDPSGRDIQLFNKRNRPEGDQWNNWHSAFEWELPAPIRCRLLADAKYLITPAGVHDLVTNHGLTAPAADELRTIVNWPFRNEPGLQSMLATFVHHIEILSLNIYIPLLENSILDNCGKNQLLPAALSVRTGSPLIRVEKENIISGNLMNWTANTSGKRLTLDAENGRIHFSGATVLPAGISASYHYGFAGPVGAGTYDRREVEDSEPDLDVLPVPGQLTSTEMLSQGIVQIDDNKTYHIIDDHTNIIDFTLQAANHKRPYLVLDSDWILDTGSNEDARLVLDGLWFGALDGDRFNIILRGDYECVIIRNCTFDPGGGQNVLTDDMQPVSLIIEANVENLCIGESIMGPVATTGNGLIEEKAVINNSIVQSINDGENGIEVSTGTVELLQTTVLGSIIVHRLYATDTLITQLATVVDTQAGCFRFSAAPALSRLPHPYESFLFTGDNTSWFSSTLFGKPPYAQLSETAPAEVQTGAENKSEMGAFNSLLNPVKLDGLKSKVDEYMPLGLIPAFINAT